MSLTKICDGCGEKIIGRSFPAYNENHVKQQGINYCETCAYGPVEEIVEEILCSIRPFDCEHYVHEHKCGLIKTDCKYAKHLNMGNNEEWDKIVKLYNEMLMTWNAAVFGYLTFENFLRYYYNPPTKKD